MKNISIFTLFTFLLLFNSYSSNAQSQWSDETYFSSFITDMHIYNNELYIVGGFTKREGNDSYWSASYDGMNYVNQTNLLGGSALSRLEVFDNDLYATGGLFIGNSTGVFNWTGSTWNSSGSFNTSHTGIFSDGDTLYVGSDFGVVSRKTATGNFLAMPSMDDSNDNIMAFAKFNGEIIAAGDFNASNGVVLNNIARWNGTSWEPLGSGLDGSVMTMAVFNDELYVGGRFSTAGGNNAKYIAKWDGTTWSNVGGSVTDAGFNGLRDMTVFEGKIYITGDFTEVGGVTSKYVSAWDGTIWEDFSLDISSNYGTSIEIYGTELFVGVFDFSEAHLYSRPLYALSTSDIKITQSFDIYPNPSSDVINIEHISGETSQLYEVEIIDIQGRPIMLTDVNTLPQQLDISQLNSGMYFILVKDETNKVIMREQLLKL